MLRFGTRLQKKKLLVGVNDPDALSENIIETLAADESVVGFD
jgi:hypothetical protein